MDGSFLLAPVRAGPGSVPVTCHHRLSVGRLDYVSSPPSSEVNHANRLTWVS